jgi:trehalose/maltose hydrolase-like predicted phosphorylase
VRWRTVAETMVTGWNSQTGPFEQFAGFFGLEEIDLANYAGRSVPMDVVLGRERTQRSKVIKQADVVALLGLLPEEFHRAARYVSGRLHRARKFIMRLRKRRPKAPACDARRLVF